MILPRIKRFAGFVIVPLLIALVAAFFGTFLPVAVYETFRNDPFELHNVIWESIFGVGYFATALICHVFSLEYTGNCAVGLVGELLWPLLIIVVIFLTSRRVLRGSPRTRLLWAAVFFLSLFVCVGHDAANYLALHGAPLFWNYSAIWY